MADTSSVVVIDPIISDFKFTGSPEVSEAQYQMYRTMFGIPMEPLVAAQKPPYKHPFLNTDTFD